MRRDLPKRVLVFDDTIVSGRQMLIAAFFPHQSNSDPFRISFLLVVTVVFALRPKVGDRILNAVKKPIAPILRKPLRSVAAVCLLVLIGRLAILPIFSVPIPKVHDEFSYLLAASTFSHLRLTNPTHPFWRFFDTIHVNQFPTYMSKYPPGQGAVLALGDLLGRDWIGVLLSCSIMCGALTWAFQGWIPRRWALLGGIIFALKIGIFSYWMNSYWGGAVASTGGSLVLGAFGRIRRSWTVNNSVLLGLGVAILANSRPFEGAIFCFPVALGLLDCLYRRRLTLRIGDLTRILLPLGVVLIASGMFMGYYNWRLTGHIALMPYSLNDRAYSDSPLFVWQKPITPVQHSNSQLDEFYNGWQLQSWNQAHNGGVRWVFENIAHNSARMGYFFLWPDLGLVLPIFVIILLYDRKFRILLLQLAFCVLSFSSIAWFFPHYAAPVSPVLFLLVIQSLRHLQKWKLADRPLGLGLSRAIVLTALLCSPLRDPGYPKTPPGMDQRARLAAKLNTQPGKHLVLIRYKKEHDRAAEWVYNEGDIDRSKVIWARDLPSDDLSGLLKYFENRSVWIVEPDSKQPRLIPFVK